MSAILQLVLALRKLKHTLGINKKHKAKGFIVNDTNLIYYFVSIALLVHVVSTEINLEEYVSILSDLAAVPLVTFSKDTEFKSNSTLCEEVGNMKLHLEIPDDVKNRLELELPETNKKIAKLKLEIEKLKNRMSDDSYQLKSSTLKDVDSAKVTKEI